MNLEEKRQRLSETFDTIRDYLDQMDSLREQLIPIQRAAVRNCSEIIKKIHRKQFETIPQSLAEVSNQIKVMRDLLNKAPGELASDYISIVQQEYGEAALLYHLIVHNDYPTPKTLGIDLLEYAYACADVIGELRRYTLDALRHEDLDGALNTLQEMDELHSQLFSLDYPKGLVPGLRTKIDQARGILARTEGDVAVSVNILKLNHNLTKLNNNEKVPLPSFEETPSKDLD